MWTVIFSFKLGILYKSSVQKLLNSSTMDMVISSDNLIFIHLTLLSPDGKCSFSCNFTHSNVWSSQLIYINLNYTLTSSTSSELWVFASKSQIENHFFNIFQFVSVGKDITQKSSFYLSLLTTIVVDSWKAIHNTTGFSSSASYFGMILFIIT